MAIMALYTEKTSLSEKSEMSGQKGNQSDAPADERQSDLILAEPQVKTKRPPFFKVVLLNDDYTPMDFVVYVLKDVFHKAHADAVSIMMDVHQKGEGVCGVYTRDVAETKAEMVITISRQSEYPLQCRVEKN